MHASLGQARYSYQLCIAISLLDILVPLLRFSALAVHSKAILVQLLSVLLVIHSGCHHPFLSLYKDARWSPSLVCPLA